MLPRAEQIRRLRERTPIVQGRPDPRIWYPKGMLLEVIAEDWNRPHHEIGSVVMTDESAAPDGDDEYDILYFDPDDGEINSGYINYTCVKPVDEAAEPTATPTALAPKRGRRLLLGDDHD